MGFKYHSLNLNSGNTIQVNLKQNADVLVMDNTNLQYFKNRNNYKFLGGGFTSGLVKIQVPNSGTWNLVVLPHGNGVVNYEFSIV